MMNIGKELKRVRLERGMTLEDLSQKCGYSKALISRVENGAIYPSPTSLEKMVSALGMKLYDLFLSVERGPVSIVRRDEGHRFNTDAKVSTEHLVTDFATKKMGATKVTVELGFDSGGQSVVHGEQFIFVLSGKIEVTIGERTQKLVAGDSLYMADGTTYTWCNVANGKTELLRVVTPSQQEGTTEASNQ
jgi:transcriptional regulator with XRE-family HTH domain